MFERPVWLAGLAAALTVPYVATNGIPGMDKARKTWDGQPPVNSTWGEIVDAPPSSREADLPRERLAFAPEFDPSRFAPAAPLYAEEGTLPAIPAHPLPSVMRFDVSPHWVNANWPRVSTVTAERDLMGMRVPIATGTQPHDLGGALTYYFDRDHRVKRLTLDGVVGDERPLAAFLEQAFGMRHERSLEGGVYVGQKSGKIHSVMRVVLAPVLSETSPLRQRQIWLEINQPGGKLSEEATRLLDFERHVQRW